MAISKEDVGGFLVSLLGGLLGLGLLAMLLKPRCPSCGREIDRGVSACPHCLTALRW